jgi:hypothetical protein
VAGSRCDVDRAALLGRKPAIAESSEQLITWAAQLYLYAAGEHVGGLTTLYGAEEVLLSPLVLARAAIENAAHTIWILGSPMDSAEDRLARAFLDAIFGAEQAKMQSGRLRGKADEEHKARSDYYKRISTMRERPSRSRTRTSMDGRYYTGTNCHRPSRSSWR